MEWRCKTNNGGDKRVKWRCKTDKDTDMASELKKKLKENDTKNLGRKQSKTFFLGNQKIIKKITIDDND